MTTRRRIVAGNWKMNHGPRTTRSFFESFHPRARDGGARILIFPPSISLAAARTCKERDPRVELGVQNIHEAPGGAYTGEISAAMAAEAGATLALVGHSERRHVFGEGDDRIAAKVGAALQADLVPVICVGETLDERRAGRVEDVILRQLGAAVEQVPDRREFILAYEPVWAIGTGETATPEDAAAAHGALRRRLVELRGEGPAHEVAILYGGSVKPANAAELLAAEDVDGVLVGGASLDPGSFTRIVEAA